MEDRRADLVVILAGYAEDMVTLLSRNPGVKSRFPTVVQFADYKADELMHILESMTSSYGLAIHESAKAKLEAAFGHMAAVHDKENGNGRAVRNILEAAVRKQALRLASDEAMQLNLAGGAGAATAGTGTGTWYMVLVLVHGNGTWYMVHGTWYMVLVMVHGTGWYTKLLIVWGFSWLD